MTKQLSAFGGMTTVAASATPAYVEPTAPQGIMPQWAAPAAVVVAASAREEAPVVAFGQRPAALQGMADYTGRIGTMSRDDMRNKL